MTSQLTRNAIVVVALVAAGFFAAWLRFKDHLGVSGVYSDGVHEWRPVQEGGELRYAVWDLPQELAVLSGPGPEGRAAASPDGRLVVFSVGERGLNADLFVAEVRGGDSFGEPRPLDGINGPRDELAPAFADGFLYFASDRVGGVGGLDLWRAPYAAGSFGEPERVSGGINTESDETDPTPRGAGVSLVFSSNRNGSYDLYRAAPDPESVANAPSRAGALGSAWIVTPLDALNTVYDEREAAWADGGRTLFFASDRPGAGGYDLYKSAWHGGQWLAPLPIEGLNSTLSERAPSPSFDGFSLLFNRAGDGQPADILRARSIELYRLPGRPVGWFDLLLLAALLLLALLAWLARRWPTLDILWKCLLVSLLIHLGIVWLLRYLYVEPEAYELPGDDRRIRVRLLEDSSRLAGLRERGGVLEVERGALESSRPERSTFEVSETALAELQPERASVRLEERRSDPLEESGPTRAETRQEAAPRESTSSRTAELQDRVEVSERRSGDAPSVAVAPVAGTVERSRSDLNAPTPSARSTSTSMPDVSSSVTSVTTVALRMDGAPSNAPAPAPNGRLALADASPGASSAVRAPVELRDEAAPARRVDAAPGPDRIDREGRPSPPADLLAGMLVTKPLDKPLGAAGEPPARAGGGPSGPQRLASAAPDRRETRPETLPEARPVPRTVAVGARPEAPSEWEAEGPAARWDRTPYQSRSGARKERAIERFGGSEETERAVRGGLEYLANVQRSTGAWGRTDTRDSKYGQVAVGKTALCLLAFLGAGHTHQSDTEYSDNVRRALTFLLRVQGERGGHFGEGSAYGHGIATYAVAEAYALTQDRALRQPLERAVDQILRHQDRRPDPRVFGGWSYYYADDRIYDQWPRVSISAWQVMALESARLGGLAVPDFAFEDAREFLRNADDPRQPWFRYCHDPDRLRSGYPTLPASTPAALFALSLLGEDVSRSTYTRARAFIVDRAPRGYRFTSDDDFVFRGQGNLYFWYYGTLAMFRIGGGAWETWNESMKATLVPAQRPDGSWRPIDIYAERFAGDSERDRSYSTALCVLSLEIYYRYYLPLLKVR